MTAITTLQPLLTRALGGIEPDTVGDGHEIHTLVYMLCNDGYAVVFVFCINDEDHLWCKVTLQNRLAEDEVESFEHYRSLTNVSSPFTIGFDTLVSVEAEVDAAGITARQVERLLRQTFGTLIAITEQFTFARVPTAGPSRC